MACKDKGNVSINSVATSFSMPDEGGFHITSLLDIPDSFGFFG